jgi:60Kd inner membrane protein
MVGTQYYQQRQLTSRNPQAAQGQQAQIMKFFPLLFGVFAIRFPAGVIVYWTVSNAIRIFQQWAMYRYDPKVKALVEADIKEVEAKTREIDARPPRPRLRDLISGGANPPADPKAGPKPNRAGGGGKPGGAKPTGPKPNGAKPSSAKPPGTKPVAGKPTTGKATPSGRRPPPAAGKPPQPAAGKPARPAVDQPPAGKNQTPAATAPADKAPPPNTTPPATVARQPGADDKPPGTETGSNGAPKNDNGGLSTGTPTPAPSDVPDGTNGAPRNRTGGGGARTGGNRGKRTRRGR